ncbi:hypothetical protein [Martelella sp. AMO21009]
MMVSLRNTNLSVEKIAAIAAPLLQSDLSAYGYKGETIREDETFDGEPIIRIMVHVETAVPVEKLNGTLKKVHDLLRQDNDERLVFLSAPGPADEEGIEAGQDIEDSD